jgi:hypothetical protein
MKYQCPVDQGSEPAENHWINLSDIGNNPLANIQRSNVKQHADFVVLACDLDRAIANPQEPNSAGQGIDDVTRMSR